MSSPKKFTKRIGLRKRRASRFKTGHPCLATKATNESNTDDTSRDQYPTRGKKATVHIEHDTKNEYFISNVGLQEKMWNSSFKEHIQSSPGCNGSLLLHKKQQFIISTSWLLKCDTCTYAGNVFKMYLESNLDESKPGTKPSSLNLALGAALIKSPIGPNVCHEIFLTLGIDCGSMRGLQNAMTSSGRKIFDLGNENLDAERQRASLEAEEGEGNVGIFDTRYNNPIYGSSTPHTFQPATQAVTTVVSNITKKAVDVVTANKHCPKCWNAPRKETTEKCKDCIADTKSNEAMGDEGKYARQSARTLKKANCNFTGVCTDRDTTAADSFQEEWGEPLEKFVDPLHAARGQKRACLNATFSDAMLSGNNKKDKGFAKKRLAEEIKQRCTAEISAAIKHCTNKANQSKANNTDLKSDVQNALTTTPFAICECYKGNHKYCQKSSFVCKPKEDKLWDKSCLLPDMKNSLDMTQADEINLRKLIRLRLGPKAVEKSYMNISTNVVEARNRGYSKTNPKSVLSTTNYTSRIMASVLNTNAGTDESCRLIQNAIKHKVSPNIVRKLKNHEVQDVQRFKDIKKTAKSKTSRILKKKATYHQHNMKLRQRQIEKDAKKKQPKGGRNKPDQDSDDDIYPYRKGKALFKDIQPSDHQSSDEADVTAWTKLEIDPM